MVFETIAFANFAIRAEHARPGAYRSMTARRIRRIVAVCAAIGGATACRALVVARNRRQAGEILEGHVEAAVLRR